MDPEQALLDIVTFIRNGEFAEAAHTLVDLKLWYERGGYLPTGKDLS